MSDDIQCRHRGDVVGEGRWACHHPQIYMPDGVSLPDCLGCKKAGVFYDKAPVQAKAQVKRTKDYTLWSRPWNLLKSLRDFVADGCRTLSIEDYKKRLDVCTDCEHRERNTCGICGCYLSLKARGRAFRCPLDKWPQPSEPSAPKPPDPE